MESMARSGPGQSSADIAGQFLLLSGGDDSVHHHHDEADNDEANPDPQQVTPIGANRARARGRRARVGDHGTEDEKEAQKNENHSQVECCET